MSVRFFGQFLLEKGAITAEQLLAAINYQEENNRKFGETAIEMGLLTQDRLNDVLSAQRSLDLKTGEICVQKKFLTDAQVEQVLRKQRNSHILIGEAIIATGGLTRPQMEVHLGDYKKEQDALKATDAFPTTLDPTGVATNAVDLTTKFLKRLAGIECKMVAWRTDEFLAVPGASFTACVPFSGDRDGEFVIRLAPGICTRLVSRMIGEPVSAENVQGLLDGLGEFLNLVAGNISAALARLGTELEPGTPRSGEPASPEKGDNLVVVHLRAPEGEVDLAILTKA